MKRKENNFCMTEEEFHAHNEEYNGICFNCGEIRWGDTEPDARNYPCEEGCGKNAVYGISEALMMGKIRIVEEMAR